MRRLLFPHMSDNARTAAILWLVVLIAAGAIILAATMRPAAAAGALDLIAPAGAPVGQPMALAVITGAAFIGCVGGLMLCRVGRPLPRRRI
ncbi:MAG: hypothetical protein K0R27_283 [Xanthobacteraceae bacterium]|jgi:hypothetical protein|nr:hypothetical protein [Xanthobacteraceae bacterium]